MQAQRTQRHCHFDTKRQRSEKSHFTLSTERFVTVFALLRRKNTAKPLLLIYLIATNVRPLRGRCHFERSEKSHSLHFALSTTLYKTTQPSISQQTR